MEAVCLEMLQRWSISERSIADAGAAGSREIAVLQAQVARLQSQLLEAVTLREQEDLVFLQATRYATAKATANAVLHALFDQASAGKHATLAAWLDTGVIATRDGLKHWRLDMRELRNEAGTTLLHVAVDVSMARQPLKVKLVQLLVDQVGFDPNVQDVVRAACVLAEFHTDRRTPYLLQPYALDQELNPNLYV